MTVLIPVNNKSRHECTIASIEENKAWALVRLDEGKICDVEFYERREDILDWIDSLIVINEQEFAWPFLDEGVEVLIARTQKSIDEIIEGYLFKDLHDF
ncbi:MAG: hypothetical protein ACQERD_07605 [Campylobacterota bacterium]